MHLVHETVVTPWEQKGLVMRSLVEMADGELRARRRRQGRPRRSWVLALPDPEEPVTHVWAEAGSAAEARRLAQEYAPAHPPAGALTHRVDAVRSRATSTG